MFLPAAFDANVLNPSLALVLCSALLWVGSAVAWEATAPGALRTGSLDLVAVVLLAAVVDGVLDWITRTRSRDGEAKPIGLVAYVVLKRLDDLAYGTGLWVGVVRERTLRPLKPQIKT